MNKILKRIIILVIFFGSIAGIVGACFVVVSWFVSSDEGFIVDYQDQASVDLAEQQGILVLNPQEVMVRTIGQDEYSVGVVLRNENTQWSARNIKYVLFVGGQKIDGVADIFAGQERLIQQDVEHKGVLRTDDVRLYVEEVNWYVDKHVNQGGVILNNKVVETRKQEDEFVSFVAMQVVSQNGTAFDDVHIGVVVLSGDGAVIGFGTAYVYAVDGDAQYPVEIEVGGIRYTDVASLDTLLTYRSR